MAASSKKKKDKKKDFQKTKLKVGKTKAQPANFTDTSFKAKSIVLNQQSLSEAAPSAASQFDHHLSLLNHKSDTQRRDSLAFLTSTVSAGHIEQPVAVVVPRVKHLVCDGSRAVRTQLLKLLEALPAGGVGSHAPELLLWLQAGMTHMVADIRSSSLDILTWLCAVAGQEVVSCAGGWIKTLRCFMSILAWTADDNTASRTSGWSATRSSAPVAESKLLAKTITVLSAFLKVGLAPPDVEAVQASHLRELQRTFPLTDAYSRLIPRRSNPYAHLSLFGAPVDEDGASYEGPAERMEVFVSKLQAPVMKGLEWAKKEQGEVGRAANSVQKVLREGTKGP